MKKSILVEISPSYIRWLEKHSDIKKGKPLTNEEISSYVNEVLAEHKASWEELKE